MNVDPSHSIAMSTTLTVHPASSGPGFSSGRRASVSVFLLVAALALAACGASGGSPTPPPVGTSGPTPAPTTDPASIEHATGALDVVFQLEQGGGFVPIGFFATQAPQFILYGDGTVIFRDFTAAPPVNDKVGALTPYLIADLSEPEVQAFLRFALADSGLGIARASYNPGNVADAPSSMFTVKAGGLDKVVSVEALGFENPQSPDSAILKALAALGERISNFATSVSGETPWAPAQWRGILTPNGFGPAVVWPWKDITPADFVQPADPNAPQFPIHTLSAADVEALGLTGIEGGFANLPITGPDGTLYTLALRPILPGESR